MTLDEIRAAVRLKTGLPVSDTLVTDLNLLTMANEANHIFELEADWPWLEAQETIALAVNDSVKAPAADYVRSVSLRINTFDDELERWDIAKLDQLINVSGRPRYWAPFAGQLEFRPKADIVYSLRHRYLKTEPELLLGTDNPLSPKRWHYILVEMVSALVWRRVQEPDKAGQALAAYQAGVKLAKARSNLASADQGGGVGGDKA